MNELFIVVITLRKMLILQQMPQRDQILCVY